MTKTPSRSRGYLLIEVMVSGTILAVILGAAVSVVASERVLVTAAGNRAKASALAQELMNQLLADTNPATAVFTCDGSVVTNDPAIDAAKYPRFERRYACDLFVAAENAAELGSIYQLTVEVDYPTSADTIKTIQHMAMRRDRIVVITP